jgi:Transposase DDE domain
VLFRDEGAYWGRRCLRVVHTLTGTAANEADINQMAAVRHAAEEAVFADAGYTGADKRPEHADRAVSWNIAIKRGIIKAFSAQMQSVEFPRPVKGRDPSNSCRMAVRPDPKKNK